MGTRSLTIFQEDGRDVCVLYRQFDGYMSGHGKELRDFLKKFKAVTNGISSGEKRKTANGVGCLAAQTIAHFKTEVGNFYVEPCGTRNAGEQYRYVVTAQSEAIYLTVHQGYGDNWQIIYDGPVSALKIKKDQ